jgi:hypothetical protein
MSHALHVLGFLSLSAEALRALRRDDGIPEACKLSVGGGLTARLLEKARTCTGGLEIHGAVQQFGDEIDAFLIPFTQWRVTHTSQDRVVLRPVPSKLVPLFEDINRVQFAPRGDTCDGLVSASGQLIGAATQDDLRIAFVNWYKGEQEQPFVPIWMPTGKPANTSDKYLEPFCNLSSLPTTRHDCFFLPTSNCVMGAQQWERIRKQVDGAGRLSNVTIDRAVSHVTIDRTIRKKPKNGEDLAILWNMLFFRQNAKARSEIARREIAWRAENPSWPAMPLSYSEQRNASVTCAAVHIRHGDKLTPYWMKVHHTMDQGFNRSFDDYLDEALNLLQKATGVNVGAEARVFVMSDDADIIEASMKTKRATTFHVDQAMQSLSETLQTSDNDSSSLFKYRSSGSEDMFQWLLAIRLMSACDVFVGNLVSGFAKFVYHGLCEQRQGNCPNAVTLGCGSDSSEEFNVNISQPSVVQRAACA